MVLLSRRTSVHINFTVSSTRRHNDDGASCKKCTGEKKPGGKGISGHEGEGKRGILHRGGIVGWVRCVLRGVGVYLEVQLSPLQRARS